MPSQGPLDPTVAAGWTDSDNVFASDDAYATFFADASGSDVLTDAIVVRDFGFSIPGGATIDGIVAEVERSVASGASENPRDASVYLLKDDGGSPVAVGNDRALVGAAIWDETDTYSTYGAVDDTWDAGLTAADVNHENFGILVSCYATRPAIVTFQIDHVRITVYYTEFVAGQPASKRQNIIVPFFNGNTRNIRVY